MSGRNLIKEVRESFNLSYAELAEITGAKESTLKKSSSTGEIGDIIKKSIEWYIRYKENEEKMKKMEQIKLFFKDFLELK